MKMEFGWADKQDDRELRHLFVNNPVPGNISLVYTREPSFFDCVDVMGRESHVLVARTGKKIAALGVVSTLDCYINGQETKIGYLSSLRVDKKLGNPGCLFNGFDFFKTWDANQDIPFYLSTIIEDNVAARKILTSNRMSIPMYTDMGRYITYAVLLYRRKEKPLPLGYRMEKITDEADFSSVLEFINSQGAKKQFHPVYTEHDLKTRFRGFDFRELWVCRTDDGIQGTIGVWDQSAFKQTNVHAYNLNWRLLKPCYNFFSSIFGYKKLPETGAPFTYPYVSFIAVKDNDPLIFETMLNHIFGLYQQSDYHYMIVGLHEHDPLNRALKKFRVIKYNARMYVVSYKPVDMEVLNKTPVPFMECARL